MTQCWAVWAHSGRERYANFGPTLACEKLWECHGIRLAKETVRRLMTDAGLRVPRRHARVHRALRQTWGVSRSSPNGISQIVSSVDSETTATRSVLSGATHTPSMKNRSSFFACIR